MEFIFQCAETLSWLHGGDSDSSVGDSYSPERQSVKSWECELPRAVMPPGLRTASFELIA